VTPAETQRQNPSAPAGVPAQNTPTAEPVQATDVPRSENDGALVAADLQLMKSLHEVNQDTIQVARLVQEKGVTTQTKAFGRKLAVEHTVADQMIRSYLKRKKLDMSILVAVKTSEPPEHNLGSESGTDFDRAFASLIVDSHSKAIDGVKERRDKTTDPRLKSLLATLLPTLQRQLRSAQSIADKSNAKI